MSRLTNNGDAMTVEANGIKIEYNGKPASLVVLRDTSESGLGYGLKMVKRMTEVYGWTIKETGDRAKSAKFTITIAKKEFKHNNKEEKITRTAILGYSNTRRSKLGV